MPQQQSYVDARTVFGRLKQVVESNQKLRSEIETAFSDLFSQYNSAIHENRFIVGGVAEYILVAAFNATNGLSAKHIGKRNPRLDIQVDDAEQSLSAKFSIKSSIVSSGGIRLINVLGDGEGAAWEEPTLFVVQSGVVYADSDLIQDATRMTGDALVLSRGALNSYMGGDKNSGYVISLNLPTRAQVVSVENSHTASEDVAKEILRKSTLLRL